MNVNANVNVCTLPKFSSATQAKEMFLAYERKIGKACGKSRTLGKLLILLFAQERRSFSSSKLFIFILDSFFSFFSPIHCLISVDGKLKNEAHIKLDCGKKLNFAHHFLIDQDGVCM